MINFDQYEALTFDCYGTLVDWEGGMLTALRSILANHSIQQSDSQILEQFAEFESSLESGEYQRYYDVLRGVVQKFGERSGFTPTETEMNALPESVKQWQPFPDTVAALKQLKQRYKLAIISNVDDDLFAATATRLEVPFDLVVTAQQVQSYKPSVRNFEVAIDRLAIPKNKILHVAASPYHDIAPANALGLTNVWVNRRSGQDGSGAALPVEAQPNLEVPDLQTLVERVQQVAIS
ncbi:MAG: haloacid dehalogenase type II [Leptolyngbyaceae cyanobacterium SL_7_1]|nr:haloacid dehalogenase type II [Leptolyngbyaceae cyanobacterium SL_7_1]